MKPREFIEVDFTQQIVAYKQEKEKKLKEIVADDDGDDDKEGSDDNDASKNTYPTNLSSPSILVGDKVKNVKQSCSHFGSEGVVTEIKTSKADDDSGMDSDASQVKADDDGGDESDATVVYQATNSGPNWKPGDSIARKTSFLQKC